MKRTREGEAFAAAFGQELKRRYERENSSGSRKLSDEEFAATLDVSRPALRKYLAGEAMPSVRVLVLAFLRHGIALDYFGTPLFKKRKSGRDLSSAPTQLVLPFSVEGLNSASIHTRIEPKGENGFELRVDIRRAS